MRKLKRNVLLAAVTLGVAGLASAQANIDKLKQMRVATADLNIPLVAQTGPNAEAIKNNLKKVKLPPGFKISLYAIVPDARHMAVAPSTNMLFVGTRKTTVWAVTNRATDLLCLRASPLFERSRRRVAPRSECEGAGGSHPESSTTHSRALALGSRGRPPAGLRERS